MKSRKGIYHTTAKYKDNTDAISEKYQAFYIKLFEYAKEGNLDQLKELEKTDGFYDIPGIYPEQPLHSLLTCAIDSSSKMPWNWVTFNKHQHILDAVYQQEKRPYYNKETRYFFALVYNQYHLVREMIKENSGLLKNENFSSTHKGVSSSPLVHAAQNGYLDIVKFLVEQKVDLHTEDNDKLRPLAAAMQNHHMKVVKFLIEQEIILDLVDDTTLQIITNGDFAALKFFCEKAKHKDRLILVLHSLINNNHLDKTELIIDSMDPRVFQDSNNLAYINLAFRAAAKGNHVEIARKMLTLWRRKYDSVLSTALNFAASKGHLEMVRFLVENNIKPSKAAIELAHKNHHTAVEEFLRKHSSRFSRLKYKINHLNFFNKDTKYHFAPQDKKENCHIKSEDAAALIEERHQQVFQFAKEGNLEKLNEIIQKSLQEFSFDELNKFGLFPGEYQRFPLLIQLLTCTTDSIAKHPWHWVTFYQHQHILDAAYKEACSPEFPIDTLFLMSVCYNQINDAKNFLQKNMELIKSRFILSDDKVFSSGVPLIIAAKNGYLDMVKLLVEKGADLNVKDDKGLTPFAAALQSGNIEMVKYFIKEKHYRLKSSHQTSLQTTLINEHLDLIKYLFEVNPKNEEYFIGLLMTTLWDKQFKITHFIIDNANQKTFKTLIPHWFAALNSAVVSNYLSIAEKILQKDTNKHLISKASDMLSAAEKEGHHEMVQLLEKYGVKRKEKEKSFLSQSCSGLSEFSFIASAESKKITLEMLDNNNNNSLKIRNSI